MASVKRFSFFCFTMLLLSACALFFLWDKDAFSLSNNVEIETPYLVRDVLHFRYILDKQRMRILVIDKDTNIVQTVLPRKTKNADVFYYADDFLFDEKGWVYVKEGAWDGNCISREAVLIYDNEGRYRKTVIDTHYDDVVNKHKIMLLSVRNGIIHYAVKEKQSVVIVSYDIERNKTVKATVPFDNAFDFVCDMAEAPSGDVYLLDKTGCLFILNEKGTEFVRIWRTPAEEYPNWIEAETPGTLLYTDLYSDSVMRLNVRTGEKSCVIEDADSVTVTPVSFNSLKNPLKNKSMLLRQSMLFFVLALFTLCALYLFIRAVIIFFKRNIHIIQRISFYIIIIVIAVSVTITYRLTNEFSKVMTEQLFSQMENTAQLVAKELSPSDLDSIRQASDYASESYRNIISAMEKVIDVRLKSNRSIYCDILKYDEKHGAYAMAYLDQAIGSYFPLPESAGEEVKQIYETGQTLYSNMGLDTGFFTYVCVPVLAENNRVCGVVEVLTENFMLAEKINGMKKNVLLGIVITLIFVWLLMGESLSYILSKSQVQMEAQERIARGEVVQKSFPHYYIRLMVFALFAAYNMTTTFLPMVIAKGALETLGGDCSNFIAALPISVNLFIIGLMALFCESLIRKAGIKKVLVAGTCLSALSNLLIFVFPVSYSMLFIALVVDGIGVGLSTNAMYLMVSQIPDAKNRTSGYAAYNAAQFSGINFGMLCGAALALNVGRQMIFPLVSIMWLISAFIFILLYRTIGFTVKDSNNSSSEENKTRFTPRRILSFLCQRSVWSYILLVQAPFALMGSFVYYYLPFYSESHELSEVAVAVLMMLYSMFAIYLGNGLSKWVIRRTGAFSPYVSIMLSACAVLVYALLNNFTGLLISIFLLGLANGFGRTVQQSHFSLLEECEAFGVADAMGIYNFTEFVGQSFGPAVIGVVFLSKNMVASTIAFAVSLTFVCVLHIFINLNRRS